MSFRRARCQGGEGELGGKELAFIGDLLCARVDWDKGGRQEGGAACWGGGRGVGSDPRSPHSLLWVPHLASAARAATVLESGSRWEWWWAQGHTAPQNELNREAVIWGSAADRVQGGGTPNVV